MGTTENDWLKKWFRYTPDAVAVKDAESGTNYTYSAMYRLSCVIATRLLKEFGIKKGDRIAVMANNEVEYLPLFFATQRLGAILVPLNFRLTAREIAHILEDSSPSLLIYQESFVSLISSMPTQTVPTKRWSFDSGADSLRQTVASLLQAHATDAAEMRFSAHPKAWEVPMMTEFEDACMILYTSGTTGAPKGAIITSQMIFWNSINTGLRLNLTQTDVTVSFLPFFHTSGWNVLNTPFLHRGARLVFLKKFDANRVLELCEQERATVLFGVPTTMDIMFHSPLFEKVDLSSVRYAIVGGEPMSIELIKSWQAKGIPVRQGFGLTEFGPSVFSLPEEDSLRKIGSIGFPNFYVETRIVDDHGNDVPNGQIGELLLKGPVCTPGYWNNAKATADTIKNGWLHTGDLVRQDDEGYFYVAGRKKDMFISGGENVYPVEIERFLSTHPKIREVAVIGVPDEKWGEVGKAYIALVGENSGENNGENKLTKEEILAFCSGNLARYKIPKHVEFLPELPKGDSGKILKRKLREGAAQV